MKKTIIFLCFLIMLFIQVFFAMPVYMLKAANFTYSLNFETNTVASFTGYKPNLIPTTNNLALKVNYSFTANYYFNTCTGVSGVVDMQLQLRYQFTTAIGTVDLPNISCTTSTTPYSISGTFNNVTNNFNALTLDDANYNRFDIYLFVTPNSSHIGKTLTFTSVRFDYDISYSFNSTYPLTHILLDRDIPALTRSDSTNISTANLSYRDYLVYVYNDFDTYTINNTNTTNSGNTRKKFALPFIDDTNLNIVTAKGVGVGTQTTATAITFSFNTSSIKSIYSTYNLWYLNTSNRQVSFTPNTLPTFTYIDPCSVWDMKCGFNNLVTYVVKDMPVTSSIYSLASDGYKLIGTTFQYVTSLFSTNNLFIYMLMIAFGGTIVSWLYGKVSD